MKRQNSDFLFPFLELRPVTWKWLLIPNLEGTLALRVVHIYAMRPPRHSPLNFNPPANYSVPCFPCFS